MQRFAENLVFNEAPRFLRQLEQMPGVQQRIQQGIEQGIKIGLEALAGAGGPSSPEIPTGRPVTHSSVPTAHRARRLVYAPDLNGRADPGEIVWTWVAYEDNPDQGKDRPVLVVGRDHTTLLGLMLSSRDRHADDTNWVGIGTGDWDGEHRDSWVRLDADQPWAM